VKEMDDEVKFLCSEKAIETVAKCLSGEEKCASMPEFEVYED